MHAAAAQRQRRRCAGSDIGRLGMQEFGNDFARALEQLLHVHVVALDVLHGALYARRRRRAAQHGVVSARIDDRRDAELFEDVAWGSGERRHTVYSILRSNSAMRPAESSTPISRL